MLSRTLPNSTDISAHPFSIDFKERPGGNFLTTGTEIPRRLSINADSFAKEPPKNNQNYTREKLQDLQTERELLCEPEWLLAASKQRMSRLPSDTASSLSLLPNTNNLAAGTENGVQRKESLSVKTEAYKRVLVIGVGYVGTHLVERFSSIYHVTAFDISQHRCAILTEQFSHIKTISVTNSLQALGNQKFELCLIAVPTLLKNDGATIETRHLCSAIDTVKNICGTGTTVVLESSVAVGMSRNLLAPLRAIGMFVGFSPERVDPGRVAPIFQDIPKIVSGIDEESLEQVLKFYIPCFQTVVPVSSLETAEFSKLVENCQRLMLIAYINEVADSCEQHNVDVWEVCEAMATKPFGYSLFQPSLGAGGHCIPVNPYYLLHSNEMPLLRLAAESNANRANEKAYEIFKKAKLHAASPVRFGRLQMDTLPQILILGLGFKRGQGSLSFSPSVKLAATLQNLGACITFIDDLVQDRDLPYDNWIRESMSHFETDLFLKYPIEEKYDAVVVTHTVEKRIYYALNALKDTLIEFFARAYD